jgi:hypothetical protein
MAGVVKVTGVRTGRFHPRGWSVEGRRECVWFFFGSKEEGSFSPCEGSEFGRRKFTELERGGSFLPFWKAGNFVIHRKVRTRIIGVRIRAKNVHAYTDYHPKKVAICFQPNGGSTYFKPNPRYLLIYYGSEGVFSMPLA